MNNTSQTTKIVIGRGVQVVICILAAFSGYLKQIAPPDETGVSYAVGLASVTMLFVFLFVSALAHGKLKEERRKYWFIASVVLFAVFLGSAFIYQGHRENLTFLWPPDEDLKKLYVGGGDRLTPEARERKKLNPALTPTQLVSGFGGIDKRTYVWSPESIRCASKTLMVEYLLIMLSLSASIFCLTEGILRRSAAPSRKGT